NIGEGEVTLIFSMVGFEQVEVTTDGRSKIDIVLQEGTVGLDEVTVVGYSEVDTEHLASSVSEVEMDDIQTRSIAKLEEAFSGTVPGVTLMQGSNLPGSIPGTISI